MLKNSLKNTSLLSLLMILALFGTCSKENASTVISLTSFGPSGVQHGDTIKFLGKGLNQVTSVVMPVDNEVPASAFIKQTSTLIELIVPIESTTGYVTLKTPKGDVVSKTTFGSAYKMTVTSFTPSTITPGANITINGNFLNYVKQVTFFKNLAVTQFVSQSRTQLVVQVPMTAQTGGISLTDLAKTPSVVDQDDSGNSLILSVNLPAVTSLSPSSIEQTKNLTITGTNLDLVNEVDFSSGVKVMPPFVSQTATQIVVAVPNTAVTGALTLTAVSGIKTVTSQSLTVIEPAVTSIPAVRNGTDMVITGTALNLVANILFPDSGLGTAVASSSFTNVATDGTSITVTLPASAIPGSVQLTTIHGFKVSVPNFKITLPVATNYATGATTLTITGTDLDLVKGIIFPDGASGVTVTSFNSQSPTSIGVTIPGTATSGTLKFVIANGYTATQPLAFGSACVTNFPAGQLLFSFDSDISSWGGGTNPYPTPAVAGQVVAFIGTDGHSCLGALQMTIPFTAYGQNTDAEINPGPPMDFTGKSKLHFWAKVQVAGGATAAINGVQFYVNTGGYSKYSGHFISLSAALPDGGSFADGNWHEGVYDISGNTANIVIGVINQFGVQVLTQSAAPSGGPATPPTVTLLIDDIWLE